MSSYPEKFVYTKEHEWARVAGNKITVGITSFAKDQLGDVVYLELPEVGATVTRGQPFGVVEDRVQWDIRLRRRSGSFIARVRVRARQDVAQVRPASCIADEQPQMASLLKVDLGAVDRAQAERPGSHGELHRARDRVVIGQRERLVAQLHRRPGQLVGQRGPIEKREGGVTVELGVGRHERTHVRTWAGRLPQPLAPALTS